MLIIIVFGNTIYGKNKDEKEIKLDMLQALGIETLRGQFNVLSKKKKVYL